MLFVVVVVVVVDVVVVGVVYSVVVVLYLLATSWTNSLSWDNLIKSSIPSSILNNIVLIETKVTVQDSGWLLLI